jgi:hypothetical protein
VKRLNLRRKHVARIFQELLSKYGVKKVFHSVGKTSEYRYFINQSFVVIMSKDKVVIASYRLFQVPPQHCAPPQRQLPALQETDLDFLVKVSSLRSSRCTRCNDILEDCQKGLHVSFFHVSRLMRAHAQATVSVLIATLPLASVATSTLWPAVCMIWTTSSL